MCRIILDKHNFLNFWWKIRVIKFCWQLYISGILCLQEFGILTTNRERPAGKAVIFWTSSIVKLRFKLKNTFPLSAGALHDLYRTSYPFFLIYLMFISIREHPKTQQSGKYLCLALLFRSLCFFFYFLSLTFDSYCLGCHIFEQRNLKYVQNLLNTPGHCFYVMRMLLVPIDIWNVVLPVLRLVKPGQERKTANVASVWVCSLAGMMLGIHHLKEKMISK